MRTYEDDPDEDQEDDNDEYRSRESPVQKSFSDRYGHDERDGPPAEEEESRYEDDTNEPQIKLN